MLSTFVPASVDLLLDRLDRPAHCLDLCRIAVYFRGQFGKLLFAFDTVFVTVCQFAVHFPKLTVLVLILTFQFGDAILLTGILHLQSSNDSAIGGPHRLEQ